MKRKLLISLFCLGSLCSFNSQVLQQENFDALNIATIVGQGGYQKLNGANSDYMVATATSGKNLKIIGAATAGTGSARFLWKDGLDAAWASRTAGNNIIQIEYDFFTGPASVSNNAGGIELYDSTYNYYLGGLTMQQSDKTIFGIYTTGATVTLTDLGAGTPTPAPVVLPANTWVRVGFAYNTINGTVTFKGPGFYKTISGTDIKVPYEFDYAVQTVVTTNTASSDNLFDNVVAKAVATESLLLATNETSLSPEQDISIYPNPATDFISVKGKAKILSVYIYDMSGIRMDAEMVNNKVSVQNLKVGTYLIGFKTDKGLITKKFSKR
ncbi:T9SS type A sorting domain-containing protein [Chryseobacterium profundimaris]|uniref:Por secretion system C-terminal sorting domain-containing protein n=1 Tax=Chryseobacterium profundimaris TaxID=1387275 RepID=A0ABY1N8J8_9FLAO|nr:T9SS type A sorting domain-containing protein [Chryseobacterium profundimaris]SMP03357.1 Por secretion system C-terminal sorting domain-containing protein [Chryseobacterium profundimaris]